MAAFILGIALLPAAGSEGPRWLKIKSQNFELLTSAGERGGREITRHFEQVRAFFLETKGLTSNSGPPVRIVVFRSQKEFAPYTPNDFVSAYYLPAQDRDYIVMKSEAGDRFPVAVHEYTHLLMKHSGLTPPVWFNEGLAEFYSNLKPLAGKIEVGDIIMPHFTLLQQSKWIDLGTLIAVDRYSPLYNERAHAGLFYAESWALVHMLYLGENYRPKLPKLLDAIKSGANMAEAFQTVYGKPVVQVQKDLESYMRATSFNASLFNVRLPKEVEDPEVSESSPLEAGLVQAEILANMQPKAAEARELYNRLAREYPKDWQVEQGLARLSMRESKRGDAMTHYARAVELGSTNPKLYLDYGRLLRVQDRHAEAEAVLKRGAEIDPDDRDLRLELGYAYVVDNKHAEALAQFLLVKRVTPQQAFGYYHAMAYAYYRLDQRDAARTAVANCRKFAKTEEEIERVDNLEEALDDAPRMPVVRRNAAADAADQPPPKLRRREALAVAEGTLQQVDCADGKVRVQIVVGSQTLSFGVLDPHAAQQFTCGPQNARRIRIEYEAAHEAKDIMPGTVGVIRAIEFPQ